MIFAITLTFCGVSGFYSEECKEAEMSSDKIVRYIENANCTLLESSRRIHKLLNEFHSSFRLGIEYWKSKFANNPSTAIHENFDNSYTAAEETVKFSDDAFSSTRPTVFDVDLNPPLRPINPHDEGFDKETDAFSDNEKETSYSEEEKPIMRPTLPDDDLNYLPPKPSNPIYEGFDREAIVYNDAEYITKPVNKGVEEKPITEPTSLDDDLNPILNPSIPGYEGLDHPIDIRMSRKFIRLRRETNDDGSETEIQGKNK